VVGKVNNKPPVVTFSTDRPTSHPRLQAFRASPLSRAESASLLDRASKRWAERKCSVPGKPPACVLPCGAFTEGWMERNRKPGAHRPEAF